MEKDQQIEVVVLSVEPEKERISVGLKELTEDPWVSDIPSKYNLGDSVDGKIVSITDFGMFIELEDGVEGLVHASEIDKRPEDKLEELYQAGNELTARIINISPSERKIDLSLKTMFG